MTGNREVPGMSPSWGRDFYYRGISRVNTSYTIFSFILLNRLKPYAEKIIGDYQNGFRSNRSTTDNIFAIKMISEKVWEYNQSIHYLFIDFLKAYDSIHRDSLWNVMIEFGFPLKLINMCRLCMDDNTSRILLNGKRSDSFQNRTGLRQGDALSPLLFNIALEKVIRSLKLVPAGIHLGQYHKVLAYADDIVLIGRTEIEIRKLFIELEETALKLGLRINDQKTQYMIIKRNIDVNENRSPLIIDKYTFERVELFKFLGVMINEQNQREVEIKVRIQNANKVYYSLQFLLG